MKKNYFFSAEKMAIQGIKWHFSALKASIMAIQPCMAQLPIFSAMATALHGVAPKKNGDTRRKVALFSATVLERTFSLGMLLTVTWTCPNIPLKLLLPTPSLISSPFSLRVTYLSYLRLFYCIIILSFSQYTETFIWLTLPLYLKGLSEH